MPIVKQKRAVIVADSAAVLCPHCSAEQPSPETGADTGEDWAGWKPSIVGPTYYVPRWALDMYRPIAREAHETLRRAEQIPVLPGAARRERAARIRDATRLARQWREAVIAVGYMLR